VMACLTLPAVGLPSVNLGLARSGQAVAADLAVRHGMEAGPVVGRGSRDSVSRSVKLRGGGRCGYDSDTSTLLRFEGAREGMAKKKAAPS